MFGNYYDSTAVDFKSGFTIVTVLVRVVFKGWPVIFVKRSTSTAVTPKTEISVIAEFVCPTGTLLLLSLVLVGSVLVLAELVSVYYCTLHTGTRFSVSVLLTSLSIDQNVLGDKKVYAFSRIGNDRNTQKILPSSRRKILGDFFNFQKIPGYWPPVVWHFLENGCQYVGDSSLLPIHAIIIFQTHFLLHDVFSEVLDSSQEGYGILQIPVAFSNFSNPSWRL